MHKHIVRTPYKIRHFQVTDMEELYQYVDINNQMGVDDVFDICNERFLTYAVSKKLLNNTAALTCMALEAIILQIIKYFYLQATFLFPFN